MSNVVFISGTGRSGTNITKDILSCHSKIASLPFEHRFTIDPGGLIDFYRNIENWSPYLADFKLKQLEFTLTQMISANEDKSFPYGAWELEKWIPRYSAYVHELIEGISTFNYPASYPGRRSWLSPETMYYYSPDRLEIKKHLQKFLTQCHTAICGQKSLFVEDNTWSILFAKELLDLVPEGKLIHVVRDPRDVISSLLKQSWTPSKLQDVLLYYSDLMDSWLNQKSQLNDSQYIEIKIENLIDMPKNTMEVICDFIGITLEESQLSIDLSKGNRGRYKKSFSVQEQEQVNRQLKRYIDAYRY